MFVADTIIIQFNDENSQICTSFAVQPGEICAIVGPSGVGKSTLLSTIAGFDAPISGALSWCGQDLLPLAVWERPLACLFQSDNIFTHLSVRRNLALGLPQQLSDNDGAIAIQEVAENLGIDAFLDRPASDLSGGQQQRVGLARALLTKKPLLLLDEPFSALDTQTRETAISLVRRITKDYDLAVILITHDEADVTALDASLVRLNREPIS